MKIFVTVGSMLPFDRLIVALNRWAEVNPNSTVVAQIGDSTIVPRNIIWHRMMTPAEYRKKFSEADLVVSHVGMGTVITAAELQKPLVMLPRRLELGEVTSDHQMATAKWLIGRSGLTIVYSEDELPNALAKASLLTGGPMIDLGTRNQLICSLRQFINSV